MRRNAFLLLLACAIVTLPTRAAFSQGTTTAPATDTTAEDTAVSTSGDDPSFKAPECRQWSVWVLDGIIGTDWTPLPGPLPANAPTVALIDGAVDATHGRLFDRIVVGGDFVDGDGDPRLSADEIANDAGLLAGNAHATMVASAMARVAPGIRIVVYRALDANCRAQSDDIARAVRAATADGARVIALPLGGGVPSQELKNAIYEARERDVLVVAAAGNNGSPVIDYPARLRSTLVVGAVDDQGIAADFTSYGNRVAVSDRGVRLEVAYPGGRAALASGTSLATARTAAVAAWIRAQRPELKAYEVRALLQSTAIPFVAGQKAEKGLGAGITHIDAGGDTGTGATQ